MRSLKLAFPYVGQQVRSVDWGLLFMGIIILLGVLYQFRLTTESVNYWSVRVERIETQRQKKIAPRVRSTSHVREVGQEIQQEIARANVIMNQINLPWESLFDSIEQASSKEIALLSLQPNVANRTLRIGGEAKTMSALLDFVEAIEREIIFEKAHLLNYKIKQNSPQQPVGFLLIASWIEIS